MLLLSLFLKIITIINNNPEQPWLSPTDFLLFYPIITVKYFLTLLFHCYILLMPVVCMSTRKNVNELSQRKPSNCRLASYQFTTVRKHVIGVLDDTPRLILVEEYIL